MVVGKAPVQNLEIQKIKTPKNVKHTILSKNHIKRVMYKYIK